MKIERGNVYWADLDPVRGSEMAKTRPCVVVSATQFNGFALAPTYTYEDEFPAAQAETEPRAAAR